MGSFASNYRFEDMCVAYFLDAPHRALFFETIDDRLHGCVRRTFLFRELFLNFTHRPPAECHHCPHYFQRQTRQPGRLFFGHPRSFTTNEVDPTTTVVELSIETFKKHRGGAV